MRDGNKTGGAGERAARFSWIGDLSLDVAVGSVAGGAMAVAFTGSSMPWSWWVLLPLAVWVIYATDHQLDGLRSRGAGASRRFFHYHYRYWILPLIAGFSLLGGWLAFFELPADLLYPGLLVSFLSGIHLGLAALTPGSYRIKETVVAVVYAIGIWFGPILYTVDPDPVIFVAAFLHFLGALENLLLFALREQEDDRESGTLSFSQVIGRTATLRAVQILSTLGILAGIGLFFRRPGTEMVGWATLATINAIPLFLLSRIGRNLDYRWIGDGTFLLCFLPYWFS